MNPNEKPIERVGLPEPPADYMVVGARTDAWVVSARMAQAIERSLARTFPPAWVTFVDITGARVRVRTRLIEYICQCTAEQRALARAFTRARKAEWKAEPDWDEEG